MEPIKPVTPPNSLVWRIVHFPLVLLAIGLALAIAAGYVGFRINNLIPRGGEGLAVLRACIAAGMLVLAYVVFVRFVERRPGVPEFGAPGWLKELGGGLLLGFVLFTIVIGIIAALGGYRVVGLNSAATLLPVLALSIVSGVGEEIVVRGLIFRLVESWLGTWISLIFSAVLFGAGHYANAHGGIFPAIAIALEAGIMLAALYMITRRLWAAIGLHAAWNFTQGGIYGVAISGNATKGLLEPRITGSDLLTGGGFGAEASIPAIIVCTALGIALLVVAHRRDRFVKPFWARKAKAQPAGLQE